MSKLRQGSIQQQLPHARRKLQERSLWPYRARQGNDEGCVRYQKQANNEPKPKKTIGGMKNETLEE
jgi:hypothetical protein